MATVDESEFGGSKRRKKLEELHEHSDETTKLLKKTEKIISSVARARKTPSGWTSETNEA